MKKEDLFKVLNQGKRLNHYEPVKPKKKTLRTILMSYTGNVIKTISEYMHVDIKEDLDIIFKPVKRFTKKELKGVDVTTLKNEGGTHTLQDKESQRSTVNGQSTRLLKEDEFVNWFDVGNKEVPNSENTKCTYTDRYGNTTSLDESYEQLKRQSD